ncbi:MAG: hypothetical protein MI749_18255 [Desulfovibrionales bacterium]|nr:hypothetical protein [Desulfovibrionales bacterium]
MSSIPSTGPVQGQTGFQGAQVSRSLTTREETNAEVTIQTREGDLVTLSANSFNRMDAHSYDSHGVVATDQGRLAVSRHEREITLATGESFSFTVQGDLNEEELADIESILLGVDGVMDEMTDDDMAGAMARAVELGMTRFDSVAAYSADLSHVRTYSNTTQVSASTAQKATAPADNLAPEALDTGRQLLAQLLKDLDEQKPHVLEKSRTPLDSLFDKYMADAGENIPARQDIDALHGEMTSFINDRVQDAFGKALDQMV